MVLPFHISTQATPVIRVTYYDQTEENTPHLAILYWHYGLFNTLQLANTESLNTESDHSPTYSRRYANPSFAFVSAYRLGLDCGWTLYGSCMSAEPTHAHSEYFCIFQSYALPYW
jgi:hypothetical protein